MAIDLGKLASDMITAATKAAGDNWPKLRDFAEFELKKLAQIAVDIEVDKLAGRITESEAASLVRMQKNAALTVLAGIEGIGLLVAEAAINAAIGVLKAAIGVATGFKL